MVVLWVGGLFSLTAVYVTCLFLMVQFCVSDLVPLREFCCQSLAFSDSSVLSWVCLCVCLCVCVCVCRIVLVVAWRHTRQRLPRITNTWQILKRSVLTSSRRWLLVLRLSRGHSLRSSLSWWVNSINSRSSLLWAIQPAWQSALPNKRTSWLRSRLRISVTISLAVSLSRHSADSGADGRASSESKVL